MEILPLSSLKNYPELYVMDGLSGLFSVGDKVMLATLLGLFKYSSSSLIF